MKKVSIVIPCYNEEENIVPICEAVLAQLKQLPQYDHEVLIIDNCSTDGTRPLIRGLCKRYRKVKAIFNSKNFGQFNSPYYAICQTSGDCVIPICADFQDPVEMIPRFLEEWENGYRIVSAIKTTSKENRVLYFLRSVYYKLIKKMSAVEQIEHFTGFGLYDRSFVDVLRQLDDPTPFIRGIVAELGPKRKEIPYEQNRRRGGKTHNNWYSLYDAAMLSFTSYTKSGLRVATIGGFILSCLSLAAAIAYLVLKLVRWQDFAAGQAPILIGMFLLGAVQLFFIGLLGEYVMSINTRVMRRPLVVEEERINFDSGDSQESKTTVA